MDESNSTYVMIEEVRLGECAPPERTAAAWIERVSRDTRSDWLPDFRYCGGILRWAIDAGPDRAGIFSIYASQAGMAEARSRLSVDAQRYGWTSQPAEFVNVWTGPNIDTFSRGRNENSTLRVIEEARSLAGNDTADDRYMSIVRWRFRTDAGPLPDGSHLGDIPEGQRLQRYIRTMLPSIVPRLNRYSLIGGWLADSGSGTMASIGVYADETGMFENWADIQTAGSEGALLYRHLELIDRIAGRVTDLMRSDREKVATAQDATGND